VTTLYLCMATLAIVLGAAAWLEVLLTLMGE
jgi:hypothetical protein